jgi:hypothetical protein
MSHSPSRRTLWKLPPRRALRRRNVQYAQDGVIVALLRVPQAPGAGEACPVRAPEMRWLRRGLTLLQRWAAARVAEAAQKAWLRQLSRAACMSFAALKRVRGCM